MQLISIIEIMGKHSKSQRKCKWSAISLPRDTHCCSFRVSSNLLSVMLTHCLALHPLTASRMAQGLNWAVIPWGKTTLFIPTEFNAALVTGQNKKTLYSKRSKEWTSTWDWASSSHSTGVYLCCKITLSENCLDFHLPVGWNSVHSGKDFFSSGVLSSQE